MTTKPSAGQMCADALRLWLDEDVYSGDAIDATEKALAAWDASQRSEPAPQHTSAEPSAAALLQAIDEMLEIPTDGEPMGEHADSVLRHVLKRARELTAPPSRSTLRSGDPVADVFTKEEMFSGKSRITAKQLPYQTLDTVTKAELMNCRELCQAQAIGIDLLDKLTRAEQRIVEQSIAAQSSRAGEDAIPVAAWRAAYMEDSVRDDYHNEVDSLSWIEKRARAIAQSTAAKLAEEPGE